MNRLAALPPAPPLGLFAASNDNSSVRADQQLLSSAVTILSSIDSTLTKLLGVEKAINSNKREQQIEHIVTQRQQLPNARYVRTPANDNQQVEQQDRAGGIKTAALAALFAAAIPTVVPMVWEQLKKLIPDAVWKLFEKQPSSSPPNTPDQSLSSRPPQQAPQSTRNRANAVTATRQAAQPQQPVIPPAPEPAQSSPVVDAGRQTLSMPVAGRTSSGYGRRSRPKRGASTTHLAIDIAAPIGTPIRSPRDGVVVRSQNTRSKAGNIMVIRFDDGYETTMMHLNRRLVERGQRVTAGQVVAEVGNTGNSTGPHLHYEIRDPSGRKINPQVYHRSRHHRSQPRPTQRPSGQRSNVRRTTLRAMGLTDQQIDRLTAEDLKAIAQAIRSLPVEQVVASQVSLQRTNDGRWMVQRRAPSLRAPTSRQQIPLGRHAEWTRPPQYNQRTAPAQPPSTAVRTQATPQASVPIRRQGQYQSYFNTGPARG